MLSGDYEKERAEPRYRGKLLKEKKESQEEQAEIIDRSLRAVKKYLYLKMLTMTILNDVMNAMFVHAPDKSGGNGM